MDHPAPSGASAGYLPVEVAGAPAAGGDPTRRWALRFPDARERMAGLTRVEVDRLVPLDRAEPAAGWDDLLAEIALPVVMSDGAGPYLLDRSGQLVLVLGAHRRLAGMSLAMGPPTPGHRLGVVVARVPGRLWSWRAGVSVPAARRVAALDELDAAPDAPALAAWAARWGGAATPRLD